MDTILEDVQRLIVRPEMIKGRIIKLVLFFQFNVIFFYKSSVLFSIFIIYKYIIIGLMNK